MAQVLADHTCGRHDSHDTQQPILHLIQTQRFDGKPRALEVVPQRSKLREELKDKVTLFGGVDEPAVVTCAQVVGLRVEDEGDWVDRFLGEHHLVLETQVHQA